MPDSKNNPIPRVVLIDDDRAILESTAQWLSLSGVKVRQYVDPVAALAAFKPGSPDVIVSDIRMPGMDGMQLLRSVLAKDSGAQVILITGHGDVPLAVEAIKVGAFQFLTKPFSPEKLLLHVNNAARRRSDHLHETLSSSAAGMVGPGEFEQSIAPPKSGLAEELNEREKALIISSLARHKGKISEVLHELSIPRRTLNAKMQRYALSAKDFRNYES